MRRGDGEDAEAGEGLTLRVDGESVAGLRRRAVYSLAVQQAQRLQFREVEEVVEGSVAVRTE